jgi:type I site-specific restriction-modification system R (restriction) subunit
MKKMILFGLAILIWRECKKTKETIRTYKKERAKRKQLERELDELKMELEKRRKEDAVKYEKIIRDYEIELQTDTFRDELERMIEEANKAVK